MNESTPSTPVINPKLNWDLCAQDYQLHKPRQPDSYFDILSSMGLVFNNHSVLDLGTGPGLLACEFARRGARVKGIDSSAEQIKQARIRANTIGVQAEFWTGNTEDLPDLGERIDIAVANMSWPYFDEARVLDRLLPQLSDHGALVVSKLRWLPSGPVGAMTKSFLHGEGIERNYPEPGLDRAYKRFVADPRMDLEALIVYKEKIPFTLSSWIGRHKASKFWLRHVPSDRAKVLEDKFIAALADAGYVQFDIEHLIIIQVFRKAAH